MPENMTPRLARKQNCDVFPSTGVLSEKEYIREYCRVRGTALPDPDTYSFCLALSLFRMAAILAGVGARALAGNASSSRAAQVNPLPDRLCRESFNLEASCVHRHARSAQSLPSSNVVKNA